MAFDPKPHLIRLPRKLKDPQTGRWTTRLEDYLEVKWRLVWFRERYPHGVITTEEVCVDLERGYARFKATVWDGEGGIATGYGTETKAGFEDYVERAETRALGRALAALGIGTQFVGADLTEGEHVCDAPVATTPGQWRQPSDPAVLVEESTYSANGNGDVPDFAPPTNGDTVLAQEDRPAPDPSANGSVPENGTGVPNPTTIPAGLPCGGQAIARLSPAQLRMLLAKVDQLAAEQGSAWRPLLEALAAERQTRLEAGKRPTPTPAGANGDVP
jgi:hypothetical protein